MDTTGPIFLFIVLLILTVSMAADNITTNAHLNNTTDNAEIANADTGSILSENKKQVPDIIDEIVHFSDSNSIKKTKRALPIIESVSSIFNFKPVPIIDTIREEEKYGNTGDKFNAIGRSIVGGVETLSNLINSALNLPLDAVKKASRSTTEALNNLGGKLVGLQ